MIIILGGGLTGLTSAYGLEKKKVEYLLLEKENVLGGLCRSVEKNGFVFDYTGHFLHFHKNQDSVKSFVFSLLKNDLLRIHRNAKIYTKFSETNNRLLPYPYQANIKFLSKKVRKNCLLQLLNSQLSLNTTKKIFNFKDFLIKNFGSGITKYFFKPYNEKIWREKLENITISWAEKFVPIPDLEEILNSFLERNLKDYGYNTYFYYPKTYGIQKLVEVIKSKLNKQKILTSCEVVKIDYKNKKIVFKHKNSLQTIKYDKLISTIPLPELLKITNFSLKIKNVSDNLKYSSVLCFNIVLNEPVLKGIHWIYFPDSDIIFYRLGCYHNISKSLVLPNYGSLYVEVGFKKNQEYDENKIFNQVVKDLIKTKIISSEKQIVFYDVLKIPYAYVIYDSYRDKIIPFILRFLKKNDVYSIGRYGEWKYSYMSENIQDAMNTVNIL
ncbi:MAG: protoporphyrinogen/coproporphyrinogen oxidase [Endomicrobiia bacterium]